MRWPTPWLLSQYPIIARPSEDVMMFRRLLMASHGNRGPGDFHPPHPGPRNRKGLFCIPPRPAQQERGLLWEKLLVLRRVFLAGGKSSESAELKT